MSQLLSGPTELTTSLARGLLQAKAILLQPNNLFTWSSGWKSPIYCDNRMVLSTPILRTLVADAFQTIVEAEYPGVDAISGAATGGIAHAAWLADRLGLPMTYVRGSAKGHGRQQRVEGRIVPQQRVVLVEDTLSTGQSAYSAVEALQEEGAEVLGVLSIFSYDFSALSEKVQQTGVPAHRLLTYDVLIKEAIAMGWVSNNDEQVLLEWRRDPQAFTTLHA